MQANPYVEADECEDQAQRRQNDGPAALGRRGVSREHCGGYAADEADREEENIPDGACAIWIGELECSADE